MRNLCLVLCLLASPAHASDVPLSGPAFEAFVLGKTFTYSIDGRPYGAEEYMENRRVRWSFLDGQCHEGEWFVAGDQICFDYDDIPETQCWTFFLRGGQLAARFANNPETTELYETAQDTDPLFCLGPEVGV